VRSNRRSRIEELQSVAESSSADSKHVEAGCPEDADTMKQRVPTLQRERQCRTKHEGRDAAESRAGQSEQRGLIEVYAAKTTLPAVSPRTYRTFCKASDTEAMGAMVNQQLRASERDREGEHAKQRCLRFPQKPTGLFAKQMSQMRWGQRGISKCGHNAIVKANMRKTVLSRVKQADTKLSKQ
jgi:hypothetical protein